MGVLVPTESCEVACVFSEVAVPLCVATCAVLGGLAEAYLLAQCDKGFEFCKKNICEKPMGQLSKSEEIERNLDRGFINKDELGLKDGQIQGPSVFNP